MINKINKERRRSMNENKKSLDLKTSVLGTASSY
jgi:hypothetical protein